MDNLRRILNLALTEQQESDVTGLVFAILGEAGKDYTNGYLVGDVTVEVLRDNEKILVIECKRNTQLFRQGELQLHTYMLNGYPRAMLICGQVSWFYTLDITNPSAVPEHDKDYNNATRIEEVIAKIRAF